MGPRNIAGPLFCADASARAADGREAVSAAERIARALQRLLQLLENRGVLERRDVLRDCLALGDRAQQPPHDLSGARLRQVVTEANVLRLGDRADFLADPVAQL